MMLLIVLVTSGKLGGLFYQARCKEERLVKTNQDITDEQYIRSEDGVMTFSDGDQKNLGKANIRSF